MAKQTASGRARLRLEGQVELEYLQNHIAAWSRKMPEMVKTAMWTGANELYAAARSEMNRGLKTRTGQLQAALWREVVDLPGGGVDAEVFVRPGAGGLQPVKLRALELGSYRTHPGGVPYVFSGGKPIWISKEAALDREKRGLHVMRTKGPYGIRVSRHPVMKPALNKNRVRISRLILAEIIEGFKRERATGSV